MQSTGGVMPPDYVPRRAVSLLASGPTGGVMGAALAAGRRRHPPTSSPSTWAARASTSASCAAASPRSRPTGTGGTATTSVSPWSTCRAWARAADPSRACARARCWSGPESAGSAPGTGVLRTRRRPSPPSPTPTRCSATSPPRDSPAGRMTLDVDGADRRHHDVTSPIRSASTSSTRRGASSGS